MKKTNYHVLTTLRGLGALSVIFYHFFDYFFTQKELSARYLGFEPLWDLADPFYLSTLEAIPINIGHLGLSFFFLMTGFLIVPSLERYSAIKTFVVHKVFRLWPTYAISLGIGIGFVAAFHFWRGTEFPYTLGHMLSCLFWTRDLLQYPYIDGVVWTLEIQLKFYLFMVIMWRFGSKNFIEKVIATILVLSLIVFGLYELLIDSEISWFYYIWLAQKNLKYYVLILLGTCLYSYYKKQSSGARTLLLCGILLVAFLSPLYYLSNIPTTTSYVLGFVILSFFVFLDSLSGNKEGFFGKTIDWVSSVSYPMYIGHVLPGYTLMFFAVESGLSVYWGMLLALLYTFIMAGIVHKRIEVPFIKLNKKMRASSVIMP